MPNGAMNRRNRLFELQAILRDGGCHRAEDLAVQLGVAQRTLYRDMEALAAIGVPVTGTRGSGYRLAPLIALPPLLLTRAETEALNLGVAIVAETTDPELGAAAATLAAKLEAALPEGPAPAAAWLTARQPKASAARGFSHLPVLRSAIRSRQKIRVRRVDGNEADTLRPLKLENWSGVWVLTGWSETEARFVQLRTDLMESANALPELFVDEPGKTLAEAP